MIIAIPLLWRGALKALGSVVAEATCRGHEVRLLNDRKVVGKKGEDIGAAQILRIWPSARVEQINLGGSNLEQVRNWDAIVGLDLVEPGLLSGTVDSALSFGIPVYSVSDMYETAIRKPEYMHRLARTFYVSKHQMDVHRTFRAAEFDRIGENLSPVQVVGYTCNVQHQRVNKSEVRQRFGIPESSPVVLFMAQKLGVPEPFRRFAWGEGSRLLRSGSAIARAEFGALKGIWRGPHYRDIVESVRQFCDREGATLVGKSRLKNADPPWLPGRCDVYIDGDLAEYPYTSMQLMSIANLCVHFESGTVLEAAQLGVRSLSCTIPQGHLEGDLSLYSELLRSRRPGTLFNYAGVTDCVPYREFISYMENSSLESLTIDPAAREEYVEMFLGFDDYLSASRILDSVEDDWQNRS